MHSEIRIQIQIASPHQAIPHARCTQHVGPSNQRFPGSRLPACPTVQVTATSDPRAPRKSEQSCEPRRVTSKASAVCPTTTSDRRRLTLETERAARLLRSGPDPSSSSSKRLLLKVQDTLDTCRAPGPSSSLVIRFWALACMHAQYTVRLITTLTACHLFALT